MAERRTTRKRKAVNYAEMVDPELSKKSRTAQSGDSDEDFMEIPRPNRRQSSLDLSSQEKRKKQTATSKASPRSSSKTARNGMSLLKKREQRELDQEFALSKKEAPGVDKGSSELEYLSEFEDTTQTPGEFASMHLRSGGDNKESRDTVAEEEGDSGGGTRREDRRELPIEQGGEAVRPAEDVMASLQQTQPGEEYPDPGSDAGSSYSLGEEPEFDKESDHSNFALDNEDFAPKDSRRKTSRKAGKAGKPAAKGQVRKLGPTVVSVDMPKSERKITPRARSAKAASSAKTVSSMTAVRKPPMTPRLQRAQDTGAVGVSGLSVVKGASAFLRVGLSRRYRSATPLHPHLTDGNKENAVKGAAAARR